LIAAEPGVVGGDIDCGTGPYLRPTLFTKLSHSKYRFAKILDVSHSLSKSEVDLVCIGIHAKIAVDSMMKNLGNTSHCGI
jgi:hypothetical protein